MITENDKNIILQCAKKYNVETVLLFGSSVEDNSIANDIDVGVKGIEPKLFFKFYAELFKKLSKPVDLVDISKSTLFNNLIVKHGVRIYG